MIIDERYKFVFNGDELLHPPTFAQRVVITLPDKHLEEIIAEAYPQKTSRRRRLGNINHVSLVHKLMRLSNLDELMVYLRTDNHSTESLARYILIRRCLRQISTEYPDLRSAVKKVTRSKYSPNFYLGAVVLPDDFESIEREVSRFSETDDRKARNRRLLELVLRRQTDYDYFISTGLDPDEVRIRCCSAVSPTYTGHYLGNVALREAQRIRLRLTNNQHVEDSQPSRTNNDDPFL